MQPSDSPPHSDVGDCSPSGPVRTEKAQRRQQDTRDKLIAVATHLFATRGYDQTSMDMVAAEAQVARTTVFNHFSRKDELLRAGLAGRRQVVAEALRASFGALGTVDRLDDAVGVWAAEYVADPARGAALVRAWVQAGGAHLAGASSGADLFTRTLLDGQANGDIRSDVDCAATGVVMFDAVVGALVRWGSPVSPATPGDLAPAMCRAARIIVLGLLARSDHPA